LKEILADWVALFGFGVLVSSVKLALLVLPLLDFVAQYLASDFD
jgi:hypothetical protein